MNPPRQAPLRLSPSQLHSYGDRAVLVDLPDGPAVRRVRAALAGISAPGLLAVVPAARTVLVEFDPRLVAGADVRQLIVEAVAAGDRIVAAAELVELVELVELPVHYDGPDLAAVAALTGLSTEAVTALHSAAEYSVQFCGFAPGFAYLTGLHPRLQLPRLDDPRVSVPAGTVAIAGEFTGIYPRPSPGGWRLLGRTDAVLFNVQATPPALLTPGTRVRFKPG